MFARLPKQFLDSPCCAPHIVGAAPEEGHLVAGGGCQQSEPLSSFSSFSCFIVLSLNQPALCSTPASLGLRLSTSWSIFFQAGFASAVALSNSVPSSFIFYLTLLCKSPETEETQRNIKVTSQQSCQEDPHHTKPVYLCIFDVFHRGIANFHCVFSGDGVTVLASAEQSAASCQLALQLPAHSRLNHTM